MATMMTPAKVALGMYLKVVVRKARASNTMRPVMMPHAEVRAPDALLTAVLVKEPVIGMDMTQEDMMLANPKAINSWEASSVCP